MRGEDNARSGGEILIDQLSIHGVRDAFCVPGESYLAALDAFYDSEIKLTVCRHESTAAMMAEAVGKMTGRPGVCFVTRGPGASNASAGIHIARQDSSPMIMFVGQVGRDMRDREAFQELDYRAVFGTMAKWATEIDDPARIPEIVSRAFHTACNGRPGPVVIALPEDMLRERVAVSDASRFEPVETSPGQSEMTRLQDLLRRRKAPGRSYRRQPLERAGEREPDAFRRAICATGRDHIPARPPDRCNASLLRGRLRHRTKPEAAGAREGRRPGLVDWRTLQ